MSELVVPESELQRFGEDCLVAVGASRERAAAHIAVLLEADKESYTNINSHGQEILTFSVVLGAFNS